jgi:hypothetical protein
MTSAMLRIALSLAAVTALVQPAAAQPKPKAARPACGITWLPMVEGREWVYTPTVSSDPEELTDEQQAARDRAKKSAPKEAAQVTIKVLKVEESPAGATITLEETADKLVQQTTLKCTKDGYDIPPQSFFFAGEPGGGLQMKLDKIESSGVGFPGLKGFLPKKQKSKLTIKAEVTREPTADSGAVLPPAKLEVELELENLGPSPLFWGPKGTAARGDNIEFELTGRASVPPALDKTFEIPLGSKGRFWFVPGLGMAQVANRLGHWYLLQSMK